MQAPHFGEEAPQVVACLEQQINQDDAGDDDDVGITFGEHRQAQRQVRQPEVPVISFVIGFQEPEQGQGHEEGQRDRRRGVAGVDDELEAEHHDDGGNRTQALVFQEAADPVGQIHGAVDGQGAG